MEADTSIPVFGFAIPQETMGSQPLSLSRSPFARRASALVGNRRSGETRCSSEMILLRLASYRGHVPESALSGKNWADENKPPVSPRLCGSDFQWIGEERFYPRSLVAQPQQTLQRSLHALPVLPPNVDGSTEIIPPGLQRERDSQRRGIARAEVGELALPDIRCSSAQIAGCRLKK